MAANYKSYRATGCSRVRDNWPFRKTVKPTTLSAWIDKSEVRPSVRRKDSAKYVVKFLTGRLGARSRYSQRFKPLVDRRTPLP